MSSSKNSQFKRTTFKNGLRLLTIPQKSTRTATILVLVGTGSKNETKEISGISHFLEHMFFKGTKKRPTPLAIVEPLDTIGGMYNAFTGEEYTGYFAKVDIDHFNLALEWVVDIYLNSLLPSKEIQKEKGVVIEELNMHRDSPMSRVGVLWSKLLYGDQPAGWDIVGTKETVLGLKREDLITYIKSQYVASNTLVCVAGNVSPSDVERKVRKLFSSIHEGNFQKSEEVVERQTMPEVLLEYRKTDQTHIALGSRGYSLAHPKRYVQLLLDKILGGMSSSRIWVEVREKLGLAYYVSTVSHQDTDTGYLMTRAGIKNDGVERAIQTILREYKKISQKQISQKELQRAKDNMKGELALELEASDAKAFFYSLQELLQHRVLTIDEVYDKIDKVKVQDIQKVSKDIFQPEKLNLVVLGPFRDKAKFQKLLKL